MKLETFFEKFDQFADAPDAAAKMRELVLQLAVRGELVPQNPQDEPAAKAIEKIVALNGLGRAAKLFPEEESIELPFAVPVSWKWVRFGDLVRIRTGKLDANAAVEGGAYPFFTCSKTPSQIATYSFDTSAVILAGNGDFNLKSYSGKFDAYQRTYVIEPLGWELGFCFWLVSAQIKRITDNQRGSAIPYLRLGDIADPLVPFPPLAEQKRIVAKVDELMALCDRLEAQQKEREEKHAALARASLARFAEAPTSANLDFIFHPSHDIPPDDLRKSILTLAVQGKLVPQDPTDEPAEEVLARIAATKLRLQKTGEIGKEKPVEPLQTDSLPFEAPDSWRLAKLAELTELITKGSSPKWQGIAYVPESEGILFITSENVGNYVLRKLDDLKYVSKGFNEIEPRSILKRGDILMNLVGASIGRTAVYDLHDGANINQAVALIRLVRETDGVCPRFLLHYLNSPSAIDYMLSSRVVNAQPNISLTDAREFVVPIPPLAEQRRIVAKVEQLMALVGELETQLTASRAAAANLLSALVAELTGTPNNRKISAQPNKGTGRRGRPPKS